MGKKEIGPVTRLKPVLRGNPVRMETPKATSSAVSRSMKGNKSKGTNPELFMTRLVWEAGLRGYRKNDPRVIGKPDIYFSKLHLAVLLNGCFWHRCPYCKPSMPKTNRVFWSNKFESNRERDVRQKKERDRQGIRSLVVWECQLRKNPERVLERIMKLINEQRKILA